MFLIYPKNQRKKRLLSTKVKGFTLAEVLVSTGIFVLIMMAISQLYLAVLRSERAAYSILNAENNIRNNMELMARAIRMGKDFQLEPNSNGKALCFKHYLANGETENICFYFTEDNLEQKTGDQDPVPLFDSPLKVNYGKFYLKKTSESIQPTIIIVLEVSVPVKRENYILNMETAVTPRYLQLSE